MLLDAARPCIRITRPPRSRAKNEPDSFFGSTELIHESESDPLLLFPLFPLLRLNFQFAFQFLNIAVYLSDSRRVWHPSYSLKIAAS